MEAKITKTPKTPAQRREALEQEIKKAHDWLEGQVYGGNGTQLSSTDKCQICGLTRNWFSDEQNNVDGHYTYSTEAGEITLSDAAKRGCN